MTNTDKPHRMTICVAYLVTAISVFGASSIAPLLPQIVRSMPISEAKASLLISLFILPMALLTPLAGLLADRLAVRPVLIVSLLLYGLGGAACYYANSFPALLLYRVVQGAGAAALELFGLILLIETIPPEKLNHAIGRNAAVIGVSTAFAPLLSGMLALSSWRTPFLTALVALPLSLAVIGIPAPQRASRSAENTRQPPFHVIRLLTDRRVLVSFALTFIAFYFLFGVLLSFIPEMAAREGFASPLLIALMPAGTALTISVTAPLAGRLMNTFSLWAITTWALSAYALSMLACLLSASSTPDLLVPACLLLGIGHGLLFPLAQSLMASQAPGEGRILFISFNITIIGASQTLAPIITSWLDSLGGLNAVFKTSAVFAIILLFFAFYRMVFHRAYGE